MSSTDSIQKIVVLRAPRERVWRAISDSKEFGTWFGVSFDGPFVAGSHVRGRMVPTQVDDAIAKSQEPFAGMAFDCFVERIEPLRVFSFRWHPYAVEHGADYPEEPTTLVQFELEEVDGGTRLTVTESGFDAIPLERRAQAFASNDEGWTIQTRLIDQYLRRTGEL
jgi:uncharacterized protein YndB with AHSA1/START domain